MAVGVSELLVLGDPASKLVRGDSVFSQRRKQTIKIEVMVARKRAHHLRWKRKLDT